MISPKTVALASLALATAALPARAQVCAGLPATATGFSIAGQAMSNDGTEAYGVRAAFDAPGPLAVFGGVAVAPQSEGDDQKVYHAGAALDIASLGAMIGPRVSACAVGQVRHQEAGPFAATQVPLGVGIGTNLGLGVVGPTLSPYVVPALYVTRFQVDETTLGDVVIPESSETEADFGARAGAILGFGTFFLGGEVESIFTQDGSDPTFSIQLGFKL